MAELAISRAKTQSMVQQSLDVHLFDTPRACEQVLSHASYQGFYRRDSYSRRADTWPRLTPLELLSPRTIGILRRLGSPYRLRADRLFDTFEVVKRFLDDRHTRFADSEIFATRAAFHITRADPAPIPHQLRRQIAEVLAASGSLSSHLQDALTAIFRGGLAGRDLPIGEDATTLFRRHMGRLGLVPSFAHALMLRGLAATSSDRLNSRDRRDIDHFFSTYSELLTELFFFQAPRSARFWRASGMSVVVAGLTTRSRLRWFHRQRRKDHQD